jgi:branched-chain amino acid transport system ATP-binding protein
VLIGVALDGPATGAVAVLARNGAGKSTLLKTLAGELRASAGTVLFDGIRPRISRPRREYRVPAL